MINYSMSKDTFLFFVLESKFGISVLMAGEFWVLAFLVTILIKQILLVLVLVLVQSFFSFLLLLCLEMTRVMNNIISSYININITAGGRTGTGTGTGTGRVLSKQSSVVPPVYW
jgi:hypothetical protein